MAFTVLYISVGIVRSWTKATEFVCLFLLYISVSAEYHSCTHVFDRASSNCIISSQ